MKILYVIYASHEKSGGGHYYSLLTLAKSMSTEVDWKILNIGLQHVNTLKDNIESDFIPIDRKTFIKGFFELRRYIKKYDPDVIHCFDYNSWIVLNAVRKFIYKPLVFTKCGGNDMIRFIPAADHYIFFSTENLNFHKSHSRSKSPISLIPNRVDEVIQDEVRIQKLTKDYALKDKFVLLRIARFSELHRVSILQSIETLRLLCENELIQTQYILFIIGIIQSEEVFLEVKTAAIGLPVVLINEAYYTNNASQLLDIADAVIASGRGVMEAASRNKKILCPLQESKLPVPFNDVNFRKLFEKNFSGRVSGISTSSEKILSFLVSKNDGFSMKMYEEYFAIKNVVSQYNKIYNDVNHRRSKTSFREWYLFLLTTFYFIIRMPRKR